MSDEITHEEKQAIEKWLATNKPTTCPKFKYTWGQERPGCDVVNKRTLQFGKGTGNVQRKKRKA